jgi:hypothetical protein
MDRCRPVGRRRAAALAAAVSFAFAILLAAPASVAEDARFCPNGQSPRDLTPQADPSPYELAGDDSFLTRADDETAVYAPRAGGPPVTLHRCGQHYHHPVENVQGCRGEASGDDDATEPGAVGTRIEIHTVYAANREHPEGCDPETLDCCTDGPFLVRGFAAEVTERGGDGPISPPEGRPLAEWSGSTTGAEVEPDECKPAATWSFRLGCGFTVSKAQVDRFRHPDPARPLQQGDRLSRDLTKVGGER